jgi:hypothetical protein
MKPYPFDECAAEARRIMQEGGTIFQQFNCKHCGANSAAGETDHENIFHIANRRVADG